MVPKTDRSFALIVSIVKWRKGEHEPNLGDEAGAERVLRADWLTAQAQLHRERLAGGARRTLSAARSYIFTITVRRNKKMNVKKK